MALVVLGFIGGYYVAKSDISEYAIPLVSQYELSLKRNYLKLASTVHTKSSAEPRPQPDESPPVPLDESPPVPMDNKSPPSDNKGEQFLVDVDIGNKSSRLDCGASKCFVPSKTVKHIGYLVERNVADFSKLTNAFKVAKWIKQEFSGKHLYLDDAPFWAVLNKEEQKQFNRLAYFTTKMEYHEKFLDGPSVAVQKMRTAPKEYLFIGCFGLNADRYRRKINGFARNVCRKGLCEKFMNNSEISYKIAGEVFQTKPTILFDFQALFDINGHLYYIDLDGHLRDTAGGWGSNHYQQAENCLKKIERVRSLVKKCGQACR